MPALHLQSRDVHPVDRGRTPLPSGHPSLVEETDAPPHPLQPVSPVSPQASSPLALPSQVCTPVVSSHLQDILAAH